MNHTAAHSHRIRRCAGLLSILIGVCAIPLAAEAGDVTVATAGINSRLPVTSMAERKFSTVVRQQFDFSCGSAAIATLLTHHYDRPTSETDAFQAMWDVGDKDRIRELGFSLLEMKRYLEAMNLKADGFRLTLDRIQEIGVPGIALIETKGYRHFVVIKGITEKKVLIGDPSSGISSRSREGFEKHWDGIILFIRSDVARGKEHFNRVADWKLTPTAPYDRSKDSEQTQSLQAMALDQTRPSFSGFQINTILENP